MITKKESIKLVNNLNAEYDVMGPDGLPKWIPVEHDESINDNLVSNDNTFQTLEVYRQGKS